MKPYSLAEEAKIQKREDYIDRQVEISNRLRRQKEELDRQLRLQRVYRTKWEQMG